MKIRTRLSLQFALIVAAILSLFTISIYYSSAEYRESEFSERLQDKALSAARLLVDVNEIDIQLLKVIGEKTTPLYEENVVIFDKNNKMLFNSTDSGDTLTFSKKLLSRIRDEGQVSYSVGKKEYVGIQYKENQNQVVVIASALDIFGYSKLNNLRLILIIGLVGSVLITSFIGWIYAGQALKPISNVVEEVDNITISSLHSRVNEGNGMDEIAQLAVKFNNMLERLEAAFQMQRSFVSNASHELRTPLTSIRGEIEVTLLKQRESEEYEKTLHSVLDEIRNLSKLSNGLLELAQASQDLSAITMQKLRIDDLVWQVRTDLLKHKKEYVINIEFDEHLDDEKKLTLLGNEQLLRTTITNVMDNACKFSQDKQVDIKLSNNFNSIKLEFIDKGIGISEDDMKHVFEPFYRAGNARKVKGHGIGLSLVEKIIRIHNGELKISSRIDSGTEVVVTFPFAD